MNKSVITALVGLAAGVTGTAIIAVLGSKRSGSFFDDMPESQFERLPASVDSHVQARKVRVVLDFEALSAAYEKYGRDGVYAYLVENDIAKDSRHGSFIIDKIFMPEYEKIKRNQSVEVVTEQHLL